jgi:hypothetical protein
LSVRSTLGRPPLDRELIEDARHRDPAHRSGRHDGDGFGRRIIDDDQALEQPAVRGAIEDEVG